MIIMIMVTKVINYINAHRLPVIKYLAILGHKKDRKLNSGRM